MGSSEEFVWKHHTQKLLSQERRSQNIPKKSSQWYKYKGNENYKNYPHVDKIMRFKDIDQIKIFQFLTNYFFFYFFSPLEAWNEGPSLNQQPEKPEYDPREEEDFDRSFFDNSGYEPDDTISVESVSMHIRRPKRVVYPVNVPPPKLLPPKVSYTPPPYIPPPDYTPPGSPTFKRSPVYRSTTEFELLKN